ncbi:MAG: Crp/Fnr family transcriptional regulator [Prevotella sp.]|nr:Crp/Fnr family transcriptional regulator [Prevotella sp.]MBR0265311.1 Crp/Fnr family transcriptional regulator [Prevotella sp.]
MDIDTLQGLKKSPLFKDVDESEIIDLMHTIRYRVIHYRKGDIHAYAGSVCQYADIIIGGELVAYITGPSGRIIRMAAHQTGKLLAPAFLFATDNHYPVTVEATVDTTVLRMTSDDLQTILHSNQRLMMNYIKLLSNIVAQLTNKIRMLSMSVREKLCLYLLEQSKLQQTRQIVLPLSRQELADHFGIQKYSLLRCLNELKQEGIIRVEGRHIHIVSLHQIGIPA